MSGLKDKIKELASQEGIDIIKFVNAEPFENYALPESSRRDPRITLPDAQTLIICVVNIGGINVPDQKDPSMGQFSRLILSGFYFDVVDPVKKIALELQKEGYKAFPCDGYNDKSILPLKLAAVRAGIGWQGKNSLLITKKYGSFLALGGVITNAPLEHDQVEPAKDCCGNCEACKNACPMGALDDAYKLNVNRCLSYLLESEGSLPEEVKNKMGNMVLECDICQSACPWNRKQEASEWAKNNSGWYHPERFGSLDNFFKLSNLIELSEEDYDKYLGYQLTGVNYQIFRRNVSAALINSKKIF